MDQHYLPECYLNEFTNPNGKFFSINNDLLKRGKRGYLQDKTPGSVCYLPDYYTLDMDIPITYRNLSQSDPLVIERELFKKYEDEYPAIITQIRNRGSLSTSQARLFLHAIISIKLRNKYIRDQYSGEEHQKIINQIFEDDFFDAQKASKEQFPDKTEEEVIEAINNVRDQALNSEEFKKLLHLAGLYDREQNPQSVINQIVNIFLKKEWVIYESDLSATFVCTDNPGYCVDSANRIQNVKFVDCTFVFPITPLLCVIISDKRNDLSFSGNSVVKHINYQPAGATLINGINDGSLAYFSRYVFAQTKQTLNPILAQISLLNKNKAN